MGAALLNVLTSNQRRGAETFAYELHQVLIGRGMPSTAVALTGSGGPSLPISALGSRRYSPAVLWRLRRCAASARTVIGHGSSTLLACAVATAGLPVPFVYVNIGDPRHWSGTPARRARVRLLLSRATAVAAISARARDILIEEYGLEPARVAVIPNGRSATTFRPNSNGQRADARTRLALPADRPVLVSAGALSPEKRLDVAIQAMRQIPDATLVIAGDGPERARLAALADEIAPGRVRFIGTVPHVTDLLAAADLLVLSSDSEGVPGVLVEAGLAGVPAAVTDVGFVRDVVIPGRTGELAPPGQPEELAAAVRKVLAERSSYAAHAHAHCLANFEINVVADRWEELLASVTT